LCDFPCKIAYSAVVLCVEFLFKGNFQVLPLKPERSNLWASVISFQFLLYMSLSMIDIAVHLVLVYTLGKFVIFLMLRVL